ncbi:Zinc finger, FYVE/PHD-type [Pseudocohnilembus persalinus]|uniref:Zinc finger, FYVE/PHD-type n=1 Tax=Pseudocohnilembus persalinus TaxID=266149 RepID=A0A0V0QVY5_PSEPJ|nr:Zinc finger, FYVE/PHD-type [Pseudocohnilembus persalinus]|eukprot:KRX06218.1 Zinc finger, FYVE/PHD-type [Pseudocohnilembus persalinus]
MSKMSEGLDISLKEYYELLSKGQRPTRNHTNIINKDHKISTLPLNDKEKANQKCINQVLINQEVGFYDINEIDFYRFIKNRQVISKTDEKGIYLDYIEDNHYQKLEYWEFFKDIKFDLDQNDKLKTNNETYFYPILVLQKFSGNFKSLFDQNNQISDDMDIYYQQFKQSNSSNEQIQYLDTNNTYEINQGSLNAKRINNTNLEQDLLNNQDVNRSSKSEMIFISNEDLKHYALIWFVGTNRYGIVQEENINISKLENKDQMKQIFDKLNKMYKILNLLNGIYNEIPEINIKNKMNSLNIRFMLPCLIQILPQQDQKITKQNYHNQSFGLSIALLSQQKQEKGGTLLLVKSLETGKLNWIEVENYIIFANSNLPKICKQNLIMDYILDLYRNKKESINLEIQDNIKQNQLYREFQTEQLESIAFLQQYLYKFFFQGIFNEEFDQEKFYQKFLRKRLQIQRQNKQDFNTQNIQNYNYSALRCNSCMYIYQENQKQECSFCGREFHRQCIKQLSEQNRDIYSCDQCIPCRGCNGLILDKKQEIKCFQCKQPFHKKCRITISLNSKDNLNSVIVNGKESHIDKYKKENLLLQSQGIDKIKQNNWICENCIKCNMCNEKIFLNQYFIEQNLNNLQVICSNCKEIMQKKEYCLECRKIKTDVTINKMIQCCDILNSQKDIVIKIPNIQSILQNYALKNTNNQKIIQDLLENSTLLNEDMRMQIKSAIIQRNQNNAQISDQVRFTQPEFIDGLNCYLCGSFSYMQDLLQCNKCLEYYHLYCVIPVGKISVFRNKSENIIQQNQIQNWTCQRCKVCQICQGIVLSPDQNIFCFDCDNFYHIHCLQKQYNKQIIFDTQNPENGCAYFEAYKKYCMICKQFCSNRIVLNPQNENQQIQLLDIKNQHNQRLEDITEKQVNQRVFVCKKCQRYYHEQCVINSNWNQKNFKIMIEDNNYQSISYNQDVDQICQYCIENSHKYLIKNYEEKLLHANIQLINSKAEKKSQELLKSKINFFLNQMGKSLPEDIKEDNLSKSPLDNVPCQLCFKKGNRKTSGRLLNYEIDKWVHANCALYSDDVQEQLDGGLYFEKLFKKVTATNQCYLCEQQGATISCVQGVSGCKNKMHFSCGIGNDCPFLSCKSAMCHICKLKLIQLGEEVSYENELFYKNHKIENYKFVNNFCSNRKLYIKPIKDTQPYTEYNDKCFNRVGTNSFINIGKLLKPLDHEILCDMIGINSEIIRSWILSGDQVNENNGTYNTIKEYFYESRSFEHINYFEKQKILEKENQKQIVEKKKKAKKNTGSDHSNLSKVSLRVQDLLLDGNWEKNINLTQTKEKEFEKKMEQNYQIWSNQQQYKHLNVYVAPSQIHKYGLFTKKKFEKDEIVIEYVGEKIRNVVADSREIFYEQQGFGDCYLFRANRQFVIDATFRGNEARYLNHSCDPTCSSIILEINQDPKIIIYAKREIEIGEEITYDYHFEAETEKLKCTCGAENCQGILN